MFEVEIKLKKEEIADLEETIESLRKFGYAHIQIGKEYLVFHCPELVKNREKYEEDLKKIKKEDN